MTPRSGSPVGLILAVLLAATSARAEDPAGTEPSPVRWHDDWPRFRPAEYVATGLFAASALTVAVAVPQPDPSWHGGALFDDWVRDGLRAQSRSGRERAAVASDVLLYSTMAIPVLGDAGLAAWAGHHERDTAAQMALLEAESFSLSFALAIGTKRIAARERPLVAECRKDRDYSPACSQSMDGSFYSGHTNGTFTAAGLVCLNHMYLPLWGGGIADAAACAGALGLATTTGLLRIVADRHYATDVLAGAAAGLSSGMLVPWLLHYRGGAGRDVAVVPVAADRFAGIFVTGRM